MSDEDQYSSRDDNINKALVAAESRDAAIHASSDDGDEGEILHCRWAECTMQTRSLQRLIAHVSDIHVGRGKQAYYCEWINCPRKNMPFSKRHKMHNHMRTHTGERPFACNEDGCDKRFSRLDSLNTHIKTHSSVKPYACSVPGCTKAYFHSRSLRKHAKVHQIQRDPHGKRKRAGRKKKTSIIAILRKTTWRQSQMLKYWGSVTTTIIIYIITIYIHIYIYIPISPTSTFAYPSLTFAVIVNLVSYTLWSVHTHILLYAHSLAPFILLSFPCTLFACSTFYDNNYILIFFYSCYFSSSHFGWSFLFLIFLCMYYYWLKNGFSLIVQK